MQAGDSDLDARDLAQWELLYGSGLRLSELCALRWSDIDLAGASARVMGKGKKERQVPLTQPPLMPSSAGKLVGLKPRTRSVCDSTRSISPRTVQRRLKQTALQRLGTTALHPHQLRMLCHSYAGRLSGFARRSRIAGAPESEHHTDLPTWILTVLPKHMIRLIHVHGEKHDHHTDFRS